MVSFFQGLQNAFLALDCSLLSGADYVFGSINRGLGAINPSTSNTINALRRLRGCDPANDPVIPPSPASGGQCAGVPYGYSGTYFSSPGAAGNAVQAAAGQFLPFQTTLFGPLTYVGLTTSTEGICSPGSDAYIVKGFTAGGQPITRALNRGGVACSGPGLGDSYENLSFQRLSAGSECGDEPTPVPPPTNVNIDVDVTYNIDDGTEVTVNVPVIFSPFFVDLSGNFTFPFEFNLGGIDFTGNFNLDPEFSLNINIPGVPPPNRDPVETLPPALPEDEVEPRAADNKIMGVAATASIVGEQQLTTIATQNMPSILAPRAGSIKFAYSLGVSTFWSNDIDLKTGRAFIPCPWQRGADAVVVSPAPGIAVQWVPITGPPLATQADVFSTREL